MGGREISCHLIVEQLVEMGFEHSLAEEAVKVVGPSLNDAANHILNGLNLNIQGGSTTGGNTNGRKASGRRLSSFSQTSGNTQQSSILDHFSSNRKTKASMLNIADNPLLCASKVSPSSMGGCVELGKHICFHLKSDGLVPDKPSQQLDLVVDWEHKVNGLLKKHFQYQSLKSFQREALAAWVANRDCLVLAATGSGKSLCFQIPALLTGKVVVVISPLISLMHDQCLKLAKHGVSACFLGSGQPDSSVEKKAMNGMYSIVYICPETVLRLIESLKGLAAGRGIALFAIDEVHCVSKWGHDFRPDYRRLSTLRENFSSNYFKVLKSDIPVMALTATATKRVQEDIINCLCMSKETKIVLTSFYRPNLRFSVKHSKTSSVASYKRDFCELIHTCGARRNPAETPQFVCAKDSIDDRQSYSKSSTNTSEEGTGQMSLKFSGSVDEFSDGDEINSVSTGSSSARDRKLSVEYLEDEADIFQGVDDWDVSYGEFCGESLDTSWDLSDSYGLVEPLIKPDNRQKLQHIPLELGPTIIYVPTRKETLSIAKFLRDNGIKAEAYHAKLPRTHLRRVHKEFHEDHLEVVVATMAFGMGIDKSNVRRIIHYGWPQSLEAYYQEAGRAGRDGKLADCILYANLSKIPTLLPSQRTEEHKKVANEMLSDCHRYGMNTSCCRAKMLVEYFGEDFNQNCLLCDVCTQGPPEPLNVMDEVDCFMQIVAAANNLSTEVQRKHRCTDRYGGDRMGCAALRPSKYMEKPNLRSIVFKIREQSQKYITTDVLWWRGLARILESKGYIREGDGQTHVQIRYPEITERGIDFLQSQRQQDFTIFPEADMLLSVKESKSHSTFSEWGKGWADPEIRRQRLQRIRRSRKPRKQRSRGFRPDPETTRGRLAAKIKGKKRRG